MNNKRRHLFSLFLIMTLLSSVFLLDAFGADPANRTPEDMPKGMGAPSCAPPGAPMGAPPGFPPGGPPGGFSVNAPGNAAIYIENGTEKSGSEYATGKYSENIQSGANGVTIRNLELFSGNYTFNGCMAVI